MRRQLVAMLTTLALTASLFVASSVTPMAAAAQTCSGYNNGTAIWQVNWKIALSQGGAAIYTGWTKMSVNYSWKDGSFCQPYPIQTDTRGLPAGFTADSSHNNGGINFSMYDYSWETDWHINENSVCQHYINWAIEGDDDTGASQYKYHDSGEELFGFPCNTHKIYITSEQKLGI